MEQIQSEQSTLKSDMIALVKEGITSEYELMKRLGISREVCVKTGISIGHFRRSKSWRELEPLDVEVV